jgi:5-formyltetrahydrofolate cyclo-ligase
MTDRDEPETYVDLDELRAAKAALRRPMRERRAEIAAAAPDAGSRVAALVAASFAPASGTVVAGYWPMRDELDPRPTLSELSARGCRIALPVVAAPGEPLVFRAWDEDEPLEPGPYGTMQPGEAADVVEPQLLLVPMLAFDRAGRRLGYGGGFYDRTLAGLRGRFAVQAIGIAYAGQEIDSVPAGPEDARLDGVVTERAYLDFTE